MIARLNLFGEFKGTVCEDLSSAADLKALAHP